MDLFASLEAECRVEKIPAIDVSVGQLLALLAKSTGAQRVLEIGTAIGYSALWICQGLSPGSRLVTIEQNKKRAERARQVFSQAGLTDRIELLIGDALLIMPELSPGFDLVFLDATKTIYPELYRLAAQLTKPGGLIVTDNVLFKGLVWSEGETPAYYRHMVEGLRHFWRQAEAMPHYQHGYFTMSDGVLLAIREEECDE